MYVVVKKKSTSSASSSFFFLLSGIRSSSQLSSLLLKMQSISFLINTRANTCGIDKTAEFTYILCTNKGVWCADVKQVVVETAKVCMEMEMRAKSH